MTFSIRYLFVVLIFAAVFSCSLRANAVQVEIRPDGYETPEIELLKEAALQSPELRRRIGKNRFRILEVHEAHTQAPKEQALDPGDVLFVGFDYDSNRVIDIRMAATEIRVQEVRVGEERDPPYPSPEEVREAIAILQQDPEFGPLADVWRPYEAMPPLPAPTSATDHDRVISIGVLPENNAPESLRHEIVGVNLSRRTIIRYPAGAPPTSRAVQRVCAPKNAGQANTARGVSGSATLQIRDDLGGELWKFQVIRASASSGARGSGLDLRNVSYRGYPIASQIHTPIVNVRYARNICGPYRDWQYSENPFQANGTLIAPGILKAEGHPTTILESNRDAGNFRGVAISTAGNVTRLVAEIAAGWYRYQVEYLFHPDGRIQPRWGFAAIQDSCTCNLHFHSAYWRMDFDLGSDTGDRLEVGSGGDGASWRLIERESRLYRRPGAEWMRVSNIASGVSVLIEPGGRDGTADAFARGDAWLLKQRSGQIDDAPVTRQASIGIDRYVGRDPVVDQDIVVWYGAHFRHDSDDDSSASHILGPTFRVVVPATVPQQAAFPIARK